MRFSDRQNAVIHWALLALGVKEVSKTGFDRVQKLLQQLCGIGSIRYEGVMGHVYYVNDSAGIVAQVCTETRSCASKYVANIEQELANHCVWPHLRFLPEDSGLWLSEA